MVVLIWLSLVTSYAEHLLVCLLATYVSSLVKCVFGTSGKLAIRLLVFSFYCRVLRVIYIFCIQLFVRNIIWKYFLRAYVSLLNSFSSVFWKARVFCVFFFNWRIIALHYCVGFCHTTVWISHKYTQVPSRLNLSLTPHPISPLWVVTKHQVELPVPIQQLPVAIYFTYGSVNISMLVS